MKTVELELEDDLRPEYNLKELRVRRVGAGREGFGDKPIYINSDVAKIFPDSHSVNEALRFLIRITKEGDSDYHINADN